MSKPAEAKKTVKHNAVVLLSGGMDSVCALYHAHALWQINCALSFDYGAKHNRKELPMAAWHCRQLGLEHKVLQLDFIDRTFSSTLLQSGGYVPDGHYTDKVMQQTVVPFRNGIMLSIAAGFAESRQADAIVIAAHSGDHPIYPDCRNDFLSTMEKAIQLGSYAPAIILRPFVNMSKTEILQRGMALNVDFSRTWSCYKGGTVHCGTCGTCVERREAFCNAGINDPTEYLNGVSCK